MRHLITLLSAVAAATILVVGCSSSGDNGSTSNGGSGGSASDAKCVGAYADLTQTTFNAQVTSAGKCADASDESSICTNDVTTIAEQCGASCYATAGTASSAQDTCNTTCLSTMITPALSSDCPDLLPLRHHVRALADDMRRIRPVKAAWLAAR